MKINLLEVILKKVVHRLSIRYEIQRQINWKMVLSSI